MPDGVTCWMAPRDIAAGESYGKAIVQAIGSCQILVVLLSEASNRSNHVASEIELAFSASKTIIPFCLDAVLPGEELQYFLSRSQRLHAYDAPRADAIGRLTADVSVALGRSSDTPSSLVKPTHAAAGHGRDLVVELSLSWLDAMNGGQFAVEVDDQPVFCRVPPGSSNSETVVVPGKGEPSKTGGAPGDLRIRLRIAEP